MCLSRAATAISSAYLLPQAQYWFKEPWISEIASWPCIFTGSQSMLWRWHQTVCKTSKCSLRCSNAMSSTFKAIVNKSKAPWLSMWMIPRPTFNKIVAPASSSAPRMSCSPGVLQARIFAGYLESGMSHPIWWPVHPKNKDQAQSQRQKILSLVILAESMIHLWTNERANPQDVVAGPCQQPSDQEGEFPMQTMKPAELPEAVAPLWMEIQEIHCLLVQTKQATHGMVPLLQFLWDRKAVGGTWYPKNCNRGKRRPHPLTTWLFAGGPGNHLQFHESTISVWTVGISSKPHWRGQQQCRENYTRTFAVSSASLVSAATQRSENAENRQNYWYKCQRQETH